MPQPTVTQRVRTFLAEEGVRLEPWTTLDDTYARLYALLDERRDDPEFWTPLGKLLGELAAKAGSASAELLCRTEVERLTADLRRALPGRRASGEIRPLADFTASLGAPVLCAFLLLGLAAAAGCSGSGAASAGSTATERSIPAPAAQDASPPKESPPPVPTTWFDGCTLSQECVLWRSIDRAALGDEDKRALCSCFSSLDSIWTSRLTALFRDGRPAEIAKALEEMVACCGAEDKVTDKACADVSRLQRTVLKRMTPPAEVGAPLYKGVCFG